MQSPMDQSPKHAETASGFDVGEFYARAVETLEEQRRELADLQQRVRVAEERVNTLRKLVRDSGGEPAMPADLLSTAMAILGEQGDLHLSSLREALTARGMPIPGKGTDANLVGYLNRSGGRIVRKSRGVYGLPR